MDFCSCCGDQIIKDHACTYKELKFCSISCMDRYLLLKCRAGEISFLDLPKEVRDRETGIKKTAYKCNSVECPVCGTIFYTSSSFGDG